MIFEAGFAFPSINRLKETDMRIATVTHAPGTSPIIRLNTNHGIYGVGELRDGASAMYALMLNSRLVFENPAFRPACATRHSTASVLRH